MTLLESDGKEIGSATWIVGGEEHRITPKEGESFRISVEQTGSSPYEGQALIWIVLEKDGKEIDVSILCMSIQSSGNNFPSNG